MTLVDEFIIISFTAPSEEGCGGGDPGSTHHFFDKDNSDNDDGLFRVLTQSINSAVHLQASRGEALEQRRLWIIEGMSISVSVQTT